MTTSVKQMQALMEPCSTFVLVPVQQQSTDRVADAQWLSYTCIYKTKIYLQNFETKCSLLSALYSLGSFGFHLQSNLKEIPRNNKNPKNKQKILDDLL